jgi:hypothetical protein
MDNSTSNKSSSCFDQTIWIIINYYLLNIIPPVGAILNTFCIFVFLKILREESQRNNEKSNMFKYLLIKSICDCLYLICHCPYMIYRHRDGTANTSYIILIWYAYIYYYFCFIMQLVSAYCEIAAALDLILLINRKLDYLRSNFVFYLTISIIIVFSALFYTPFHLNIHIIKSDQFGYSYTKKNPGYFNVILMFHVILRDFVPMFLLVIINIFILFSLHKISKRRQTMIKLTAITMKTSRTSHLNKVKMIFFTIILYILHIPLTLTNFNLFKNSCGRNSTILPFILSFGLPIVPYILYNNTFKRYFFKTFFIFRRT